MARVKISEYAAKKLFLDGFYKGISINSEADLNTLNLEEGDYVVKVDDGTKKRNKKGLVVIGLSAKEVSKQVLGFLNNGYRRVLIEPMVKHEEDAEQYISLQLVRDGVEVLYSETGGNDVENNKDIVRGIISRKEFFDDTTPELKTVPIDVLRKIISMQKRYHISFLEINPFIMKGEETVCLDLAVEIDSSKLHILPDWVGGYIQKNHSQNQAEKDVRELDAESTATFSLTVFDKDASVFTLLSGGGASLVVLDELVHKGSQAAVANYGEYSGAPTREETYLYTKSLLQLMCDSKAEKKVLLVAGGVANFTDVTTTFKGVVDACAEFVDKMISQEIMVRVRRGGPRQAEGLALLEEFFALHNIPAVVSDPSVTLSKVTSDVHKFLH